MENTANNRSILTNLFTELLDDDRVLSSSERGLITNLLKKAREESTGDAALDAAVSQRLISATIGSVSGKIVNALADELVRQLVDGHGTGVHWPDTHRAPQVSPSNPGNPETGQVSPSNPGNLAQPREPGDDAVPGAKRKPKN